MSSSSGGVVYSMSPKISCEWHIWKEGGSDLTVSFAENGWLSGTKELEILGEYNAKNRVMAHIWAAANRLKGQMRRKSGGEMNKGGRCVIVWCMSMYGM